MSSTFPKIENKIRQSIRFHALPDASLRLISEKTLSKQVILYALKPIVGFISTLQSKRVPVIKQIRVPTLVPKLFALNT